MPRPEPTALERLTDARTHLREGLEAVRTLQDDSLPDAIAHLEAAINLLCAATLAIADAVARVDRSARYANEQIGSHLNGGA